MSKQLAYLSFFLLFSSVFTFPNVDRDVNDGLLRVKREETSPPCGMRHKGNSEETTLGEFPWMIDIMKKSFRSASAQCGGSLIRKDVILTAGMCVAGSDPEDLLVRAGLFDRSNDTTDPYQTRPVVRVLVHEDALKHSDNSKLNKNDIALLFLKTPFDVNDKVAPVCLPGGDVKLDTTKCLGTGWGYNYLNGDLPRTKLRKANIPLVDRDVCQQKLTEFAKRTFLIHESYICGGGGKEDMCSGDGGAPLACPMVDDPNRYVQMGIVAWGVGCETFLPSGYTSVEYMLPWINKNLS